MSCNTCVQLTIDACPDYIQIVFYLGTRTAGQTIYYTYTDHHGASVTGSGVISTAGDEAGWGHITFSVSDTEKAKFITGQTIVFTLQDTDGGVDIAIDCSGVNYECMAVYVGADTSSGTETITFDCPCGYTLEDIPEVVVTLCERVDDCLGISDAGSSTKYLNEQGNFTTPADTAATWGNIGGTLSDQSDLSAALAAKEATANKTDTMSGNEASSTKYLSAKGVYDWATSVFQTLSIEVTASITASNDKYYINTASATYTDPTPYPGHGFIVLVRNGTATVGGVGYSTAGTLIYRYYHSGAWASYQFSAPETTTTIGALINSAGDATPNNGDYVATAESGGLLKKITWTNVKAFLKTYFDTLYPSGSGTSTGTNTGDQTSVSGNAGTATALQTPRNIDGQSFDGTADITVIAPGTHAATSKTTPVDADELPLVDSAASNVLKKLTWANLKATLLTYLQSALSFDKIHGQTTTQVSVGSGSGETLAYSVQIPASSFKTTSVLHLEGLMTASGAATITMRWYANTSSSLSGATLLGTYQATARFNMVRNIIMNNSLTAQKMMLSPSGTASPTDQGVSASGLTMATTAVDFTAAQYIIVSIQASANNALLEYASVKEHRL